MLQLKKIKEKCLIWLAGNFLAFVIRLLGWSLRWRRVGNNAFWTEGKQKVMIFWHERSVMGAVIYNDVFPGKPALAKVLSSDHFDGRIMARAMQAFGIDNVAGSSTRGAVRGLMNLIVAARAGFSLALTPDGPKGPPRKIKLGALQVAKATGLPVCTLTYAAEKTWRLGSWDRLIVPKPFSRAVAIYGEPRYIARDATEADLEEIKCELEAQLDLVGEQADNFNYNS